MFLCLWLEHSTFGVNLWIFNHKIFTFSVIREFLENDVFIRLSCSDTDKSLCNSILILYIIFMTCILNVSFSYSVLLGFMTENVQNFMSRYKYIIQNRLLCHHTICQQLGYNIFHETWIFVYLCKRLVLRSIELSPWYRFYLSDNIDPDIRQMRGWGSGCVPG